MVWIILGPSFWLKQASQSPSRPSNHCSWKVTKDPRWKQGLAAAGLKRSIQPVAVERGGAFTTRGTTSFCLDSSGGQLCTRGQAFYLIIKCLGVSITHKFGGVTSHTIRNICPVHGVFVKEPMSMNTRALPPSKLGPFLSKLLFLLLISGSHIQGLWVSLFRILK